MRKQAKYAMMFVSRPVEVVRMPMPGTRCQGGAQRHQRDQQTGQRGLCHANSASDGSSGRHSATYQTADAREGKLCLIAHRFNGSGVRVREVVQTNQPGFWERDLQVASACDSARREEFQTCVSIRTVKRRERRAPNRGNMVLTLALIPAFSPTGTMQLLWGARASRPLFSASRRRPLLPRDDAPLGELRGALSQSVGRRLERPGRSRSPISTESFRPKRRRIVRRVAIE